MLLDDTDNGVFFSEPGDLVRVLQSRDLAVIPEPSLGIYFVRPLDRQDRAGYAIGVSGDALRRACAEGLIAATTHGDGLAKEIVYVLTARGRRHCTLDGLVPELTLAIAPRSCTRTKHDLEHRLVAAETCFQRGQACMERQERLVGWRTRAGLCTVRAQMLASTFGEIQSTFAKTLHTLSQKIFEGGPIGR
jgi:hypothetical protein